MGIFDLFTTSQEKRIKELQDNKPQYLMHTSPIKQSNIYSIKPSMNTKKNQAVVFATDDEKLATLYALYPFYQFEFGNGEIGAIILGKNHDLLNIDKINGYIYYLDSTTFTPEVSEQGVFKHEWFSPNEIVLNSSVPPKKITFDDVLKSGIQVFWVNDRATLIAIDKETSGMATGDMKLEFLINQANWTPGKFMYINAYKNICPVIQTDKGWTVNREISNSLTANKNTQISVNNTKSEPQLNNNVNNANKSNIQSTQYQKNIPNMNNNVNMNYYNSYPNNQTQKTFNNYR